MKRVICLLVSLALLTFLGTSAYAAPSIPASRSAVVKTASDSTENLSGYALTGASATYSSVTSSWTQPKLNCAALSESSYSAYWVGLDGFNDQTIEQIGTEADCVNGQTSYSAWYEMYPTDPYQVPIGSTINPGDRMSATVDFMPSSSIKVSKSHGLLQTVITPASYTLTLSDATSGKSFNISLSPSQTYGRSSAEVITEAPYDNGTLPLADYGTVNFTKSLVNGSAMGSQPNLQDIVMHNTAYVFSVPSAFDATNENFSITWQTSKSSY